MSDIEKVKNLGIQLVLVLKTVMLLKEASGDLEKASEILRERNC